MGTQIVTRAAQARCYACGSPAIDQVCHHCGRGACKAHANRQIDLRGRPASAEFTKLGLETTRCGAAPVHCRDCEHMNYAPNHILIGVGILIVLIGTALLVRQFSYAALALVLIGASLLVGTLLVNRRLAAALLRDRPPLPLLPRINSVRVSETVAAKVILDDAGQYHVDLQPTYGTLEIAANLLQTDRERLDQYRRKYRLAPDQSVLFHAGFGVLRGKAGLALAAAGSADMKTPNILRLAGQTSDIASLNNHSGSHPTSEWLRSYSYQVFDPPKPMVLPVSLVPSFIQEAGERALDLELHWTNPRQWGGPLPIDRIALLRIDVPVAWGSIKSITGNARIFVAPIILPTGAVQRIEWSALSLDDTDPAKCQRFSLQFDNQINRVDSIQGRMEVVFKGAMSAVEGVDLFYPLGTRRADNAGKVSTTIAVDFALSLAGVRYQDVRVVPNFKLVQDQHRLDNSPLIFEGVIPDYATVIALTNALSNRGFYVKRTIENPPRVGEHVSLRNRYWDIAGRSYISVYPIDFHIVLSGEEVYGGDVRAQGGTTRVSLTVHGAYANAEMEGQITQLWDDMYALIDDTIGARPHMRSAEQAAEVEQAMAEWPVANAASVYQARERLNTLLEALVEGRMSQVKIFQELSTIAQHLDQFTNTTPELRHTEVGG